MGERDQVPPRAACLGIPSLCCLASTCRGTGGGPKAGRGGAPEAEAGAQVDRRRDASAAVVTTGVGLRSRENWETPEDQRDSRPETCVGDLELGGSSEFSCPRGEHTRGVPHGGDSGPPFSGCPWDLLSSWIPTRGTALLRGCRLQSGCDGRLAQGGRAREPLRLLCGSAPAVTAATPELVSHRTLPESLCPNHRFRTPTSFLSLPTPRRLGCTQISRTPAWSFVCSVSGLEVSPRATRPRFLLWG